MHNGVDLGTTGSLSGENYVSECCLLEVWLFEFGVPCSPLATVLHACNLFPSRHFRSCTAVDNDAEACIFEAATFIDCDTFSHAFFARLFQAWRQQPVHLATGPGVSCPSTWWRTSLGLDHAVLSDLRRRPLVDPVPPLPPHTCRTTHWRVRRSAFRLASRCVRISTCS